MLTVTLACVAQLFMKYSKRPAHCAVYRLPVPVPCTVYRYLYRRRVLCNFFLYRCRVPVPPPCTLYRLPVLAHCTAYRYRVPYADSVFRYLFVNFIWFSDGKGIYGTSELNSSFDIHDKRFFPKSTLELPDFHQGTHAVVHIKIVLYKGVNLVIII